MEFVGMKIPDELRILRDTVRDFVRQEVWPLERQTDPTATEYPPHLVEPVRKKARELGLWCLGVPARYGGGGLTTFELAVVTEEMVKHRFGMPSGNGIFGYEPPVVLYSGTQEQIEKYVIPSVEEGWRWFTAISEPSGGSDPARAIQTKAVRKGDRWVINGRKLWASGGDYAKYGIVYARTDEETGGQRSISAFIVPAGTPGMSVRRVEVLRDHHTTEILFDNCEIPEENLLGKIGQGFALAQNWMIRTRVIMAAQAIGLAQQALEWSIDYAQTRETFGDLLASRQAIQFMLADSEVELRAARALTWDAAWKDDNGIPGKLEASIAKLYATEKCFEILDRCVQIHGGMGVSKEMNLEHWFRALRVTRIVEGPSEIHRYVIARELLGAAVKGKAALMAQRQQRKTG